jgi:hypothetical protein
MKCKEKSQKTGNTTEKKKLTSACAAPRGRRGGRERPSGHVQHGDGTRLF